MKVCSIFVYVIYIIMRHSNKLKCAEYYFKSKQNSLNTLLRSQIYLRIIVHNVVNNVLRFNITPGATGINFVLPDMIYFRPKTIVSVKNLFCSPEEIHHLNLAWPEGKSNNSKFFLGMNYPLRLRLGRVIFTTNSNMPHCEIFTIRPRSRPSPEPHHRNTKERIHEISSMFNFMIYTRNRYK